MSLNKYMHPRNIYKTPPDFGDLALKYEEFANVATKDIHGKFHVDFKNPHCLRVLTKCLLKADFGLNVHIPEDRLVPTLPLRLNYILWVEDLMDAINRKENIVGIDIGTGACAIYPLLAAAKNKWQMIATETDELSLKTAMANVKENNLNNLIDIRKNGLETVLEEVLKTDENALYDFCMCNPPFYSSIQELLESRSTDKPPPRNGFTGSPQELITDGGELEFIRKLIKESKILKNKIRIFTTMIGHKYNLKLLEADLKAENIEYTQSEFCQGRTTRWGLAWSYQNYKINELVSFQHRSRIKKTTMAYVFPQLLNNSCDIESVYNKIKAILNQLNITYNLINRKEQNILMEIKALHNTWSYQRRKKRQLKRIEELEIKKLKTDQNEMIENNNKIADSGVIYNIPGPSQQGMEETAKHCSNTNCGNIENDTESTKISLNPHNNKCTVQKANGDSLVHALMKLFKTKDEVIMEMECLGGTGGKQSMYQVIQYIKNNWK